MKRMLLSLAVVIASVGFASADEKAEATVKKAIEAHGGADALNKYLGGRMTMKGELAIAGMNLEYSGKLSYMLPDRYNLEMTAEIAGQKLVVKQTAKGEKIRTSVKVGDMSIPGGDEDKEETKMVMVMQDAERLTPLLDAKKFTIKVADDEEVDGKKASVVVATPASIKREIRFFFDKTTGLLIRRSHEGRGPGDDGAPKKVLEDSYSYDYKKINGIMVAQRLEVKHDGKKFMTGKVSDIEIVEKIDDKEFNVDD